MNKIARLSLSALALTAIALAQFVSRQVSQPTFAAEISPATDPIKIGYFYKPPINLTTTQLASAVETLILTRKDEAAVAEAKAAGFSNPILQYLILDSFQGPLGLTNNTVGPCTSTQKTFAVRSNQVANEVGDFCQIHDSIITGQAFDHDLNATTSSVVATEQWFIHNAANQRLGNEGGGGFYYHINHGNQHVREYFAARALRELKGSASHPATGMDGIFLDNVELSWSKKISRLDVSGQPVEYASSADLVTAVKGMVAYINQTLKTENYPLWGNMIENPRQGSDWEQFAPYLDGAMEESFALDWDGVPRSAEYVEQQLQQAESWMNQGKAYLAVSQGFQSNTQARFGLANLLLVTDGRHGVFRHGDSSVYSTFWQYPEYNYQLGAPLAARYRDTSTSDIVWKRDFACGQVSVNQTTGVATITTSTCVTPSPSPTVEPSPSPSPVPTVSPTPSPSVSPSPTVKPGNGKGPKPNR